MKMETEIEVAQAGFRNCRGTRDHIQNLVVMIDKAIEYQRNLHICFIDYSKAFDTVKHFSLWSSLIDMGFPAHLIVLLANL